MADMYKVKYIRSSIGRQGIQKRTIRALGFRRLQQERIMELTPSTRGMIDKVKHLLRITPVDSTGSAKNNDESPVENTENE